MKSSHLSLDWKSASWRALIFYLLVEKTRPIYVRFFKKQKKAWAIKKADLQHYPRQSLGYALGKFLRQEDLELMPKLEEHDIYHVLLGYTTSIIGEIKLQCFLVGNGKRTAYAIGSMLIGVLAYPEYWGTFYRHFKRGSNALSIYKWQFEFLLEEPFLLMRQLIYGETIEDAPLFI